MARLAKVAAKSYAEDREALDAYFAKHRFIRCASPLTGARPFPGLDGNGITSEEPLRNLVLTVYCLKHLRGNAILDAASDFLIWPQIAHWCKRQR